MATIVKRKNLDGSFSYMAKIRISKKGVSIHSESKTFSKESIAKEWAIQREMEIEEQQEPEVSMPGTDVNNGQVTSGESPVVRHQTVLDESPASQYKLPSGSTNLQHLISDRNMNSQIGEIFRACYRYNQLSHNEMLKEANKIKYYAQAEIERLEKLI